MNSLHLAFQCPSCGSTAGVESGAYIKCRHCGNLYTKELMDSAAYADLSYAMNERQEASFDKARRRYDAILAKYTDVGGLEEAYWGRFLCEQYVIFYQNDLDASIPSFWNINDTPCRDSESFQKAVELGEKSGNRENYERLADQIEEYKAKYRRVKAERPEGSQIFICFKDTGTQDGRLGYRIFNTFARKYDIFFSKESLLDIAGDDYEPYIYHGLTTAKVLLVLCSSRDHLESKWVHNEWWRFWKFAKGTDKVIIPIFREGFDAAQLPDELRACQGVEEDVGLLSTLSARFEAIFGLKKAAEPVVTEISAEAKAEAYVEKAKSYLSYRELAAAADYCEQAIKLDPMNGEAHLCRLMVDLKVQDLKALLRSDRPFDKHPSYEKAVRYLPAETGDALKKRNEALRAEQSEKTARAVKWMGLIAAICIGIAMVVGGIFSYVQQSRYEKGVRYLAEGNVKEAYTLLDQVKDYRDAQSYYSIAIEYMNNGYSSYIKRYGLTEFTVPDGVRELHEKSFSGCTQLTRVTLPEGLVVIGSGTFKGLDRITEITLPQSVTEIGASAFEGCTGLQRITLPAGVTAIGASAFKSCTGLMEMTVPGGVTYIGNGAFAGCTNLKTVTLSEGLVELGDAAFQGCAGLTQMTLPKTLKRIGAQAFERCTGLTSLTVPEGVTRLGTNVVNGCGENFKRIILPKSMESAYRIIGDLQNVDVFYCGEGGDGFIKVFGENSFRGNQLYMYSESEKDGCWRYVNGEPTPW